MGRHCEGKVRYLHVASAIACIERMRTNTRRPVSPSLMNVYQCGLCRFFHVGHPHRNQPTKQEWRR